MIVILPGHSPASPGAAGVDGHGEWPFHLVTGGELVSDLTKLGIQAQLITRPDGPYRESIDIIAEQICALDEKRNVRGVIELHRDAAHAGATGSTGLYWHRSSNGKTLATTLANAAASAIDVRNRGLSSRKMNNRGGYFLQRVRPPAVILETHFGSNPEDAAKALAARDSGALTEALANALKGWLT